VQYSHILDHLKVAKLGAVANNDQMLVYLIDMAMTHEQTRMKRPDTPTTSKVA
jgi:hypothetical protein